MTEGRTEARCIREGIWQGRGWRPGGTYRGAGTPPAHFEPLPIPGGLGGREPLPEEEKPRARRRKDTPAETGERNESPEAPEAPETGEAEKEE